MYDGEYYRELWNEGHFVTSDDETIDAFNRYLDDDNFRNQQSIKGIEHLKTNLIYKDKMIEMSKYMDELLLGIKPVGDTPAFQKIVDFIKRKIEISKADIKTKMDELATINTRNQKRIIGYGSIGDQLDMLYKDIVAGKVDATGEWAKMIKKVKDDNPKS